MEHKSMIITTTVTTATAKNSQKPPLDGGKEKKKRGAFTLLKAAIFMVRRGGRPDGKSKPPVQTEVASNDTLMKLVGSMRPLHLQDNVQSSPPQPMSEQGEGMIMSTPFTSPDRPSSSSSSSSSVESVTQYASATNLQALDNGQASPMNATNSQEFGKGSESQHASEGRSQIFCLEKHDKGSDSSGSRYASSTNLQDLDKGSDSRYASALNLLELGLKGDSDDEEEDDDENDDGKNDHGGDEMIDAKADEFIAKFYNQMRLQHN